MISVKPAQWPMKPVYNLVKLTWTLVAANASTRADTDRHERYSYNNEPNIA